MNCYFDTNVCISFMRGTPSTLLQTVLSHSPNTIKIPSIVVAELVHGAEKSLNSIKNLEQVKKFLMPFEVVPFDNFAAYSYGKIRAALEKEGQIIGPNDLIIAATVLSQNGLLVTNNIKEFARVKNLGLEDWTK